MTNVSVSPDFGIPTENVQLRFESVAPLVFHCNAIGGTISCDAPYSAIGFRGKFFLRCPPLLGLSLNCDRPFLRKKWGCSSDSLRYHRKHSATGVLLHLSRDRGGGRLFRPGH